MMGEQTRQFIIDVLVNAQEVYGKCFDLLGYEEIRRFVDAMIKELDEGDNNER